MVFWWLLFLTCTGGLCQPWRGQMCAQLVYMYLSVHLTSLLWWMIFFNAERTERVLYRQLVCSSCRSRGQNWPWAQQNRHCMENLTNYWVTVSLARCNSHIWVRAVQFGRNWSTFIATLIETLVSWIAAQSGMTAFSGQDWIWSPAVWGCLNYESCWGLLSSIFTDSRSYMYILAFSLSVFHSLCCVVFDRGWIHSDSTSLRLRHNMLTEADDKTRMCIWLFLFYLA